MDGSTRVDRGHKAKIEGKCSPRTLKRIQRTRRKATETKTPAFL